MQFSIYVRISKILNKGEDTQVNEFRFWRSILFIECLDHRLLGDEHTHYTFDILQHHTTPVVHRLYIFLSRSRMSYCVIQLDIFIQNIWMLSGFTIVQVSSPTITTSAATAKILELEP